MRELPLGNGRLLVGFDADYRLRDVCYPRPGLENHTLGHPSHLGVRVDGAVFWVDSSWIRASEQLEGVGTTRLEHAGAGVRILARDAVLPADDVLVRSFRVENMTDRDRLVTLLLHHDFHILESDLANCVRYDLRSRSVIHYKRDRYLLVGGRTPTSPCLDDWTLGRRDDHYGAGVRGIAHRAALGQNPTAVGAGDSLVALRVTLAARAHGTVVAWLAAGATRDEVVAAAERVQGLGDDEPFRLTRSQRRSDVALPPTDLSPAVLNLFHRSVEIAECLASHDGAVIASPDSAIMPSGRESYAYVWPRDGAFVVDALAGVGRLEPARRFFAFCRRTITPGGWFHQRYHPDGTPASTWHPDRDGTLPIQEDETALVVWVIGRHAARVEDAAGLATLYDDVVVPAAEFLVRYRTPNGLPHPSHDLWEERFGVHTFTVQAVISALTAAAALAVSRSDFDRAERWRRAADQVRDALVHHLFHHDLGRYARSAGLDESGGYHLDTVVDASLTLLPALDATLGTDPAVIATMSAVESALGLRIGVGGIARYEGDSYVRAVHDLPAVPGNPWIITTLWLAAWKILRATTLADLAAARDLIDLVAGWRSSSGCLPEQVHPLTGAPLSVQPLTWSHSTFVATVAAYAARYAALTHGSRPEDGSGGVARSPSL